MLDYGVLDIHFGLHEGGHFQLQGAVLGRSLVDDCVPLQEVGPAPELEGEGDDEDVLHLAAGYPAPVGEQPAAVVFNIVDVLG